VADDARLIRAHSAAMGRIEATAERFAAAGEPEDVAACAQLASTLAWMNHPGRFASARLERALRPGAEAVPEVAYERGGNGGPRRLLHVLTEGYSTGGHTRLAWRWMLGDGDRTHALAVTRHRPVPSALLEAVAARGGEPVHVPAATDTLLERAHQLRALAAGFDLVLLHVHPDDPVPSIAFGPGAGPRPPVLHVNHADHCYWLGREAADLVVCQRELGAKIAREQRGIPEARTAVLPMPLHGVTASADRDAARMELGIRPDQVVVLTVGSAYKFGPIGGPHFLDAVEPVIARHPDAVLLAVGPEDSGRFAEARRRSGGRVRALGGVAGLDHLYAAADVYAESYPCSSGTAVREAAAYGTPVLTFAPDPVEAEMLGSDSSFADVWQRAETVEEYGRIAGALISDPATRARWGEAARASVLDSHDEARWVGLVEDVYRRATALGPVRAAELAEPNEELTRYDTIVHRIHAYTGKQIPLEQAELEAGRLELIARSRAARVAFGPLAGLLGGPEQRLRYPVALAAPAADRSVVDSTVEEFRELAQNGLVQRFAMVVKPALVEEIVPLIEAALAAGPDVDIDLIARDDPRDASAPGTLLVTAPGDCFGALPQDQYPHQHRAA
jgi:glycosyltransferase involved in cell wall biosynthesis